MSCYILITVAGHLYACSDRCASDLFDVLAGSRDGLVGVCWSPVAPDVFCGSCGWPVGWRRRSIRLLHEAMSPGALEAYREMEASCSDR